MIIHPIEKHLVIDPPLIYTISIYRYGRLRWAKKGSPNCSAMGAVKPFGCRKSFASKEIESAFGESMIPDAAKWFDEMDRFNQEQFMGKRRNQPITPRRQIFK
jgi:hypothetical protein